jgi:hypothetical protein
LVNILFKEAWKMGERLLTVVVAMMLVLMPFCLMAEQQLQTNDKSADPHQASDGPTETKKKPNGFQKPIIRHDWSDVLISSEDLSQKNGKKSFDDLTGAVFSYSHDSKNSSDSWTATGALIIPYVKYQDLKPGLNPVVFAIAPSLSLNKVSSNRNSANEVDHLDGRLGFYSKWLPRDDVFTGLLFRGALMYGTDTGLHAALPAAELELEPRFWWKSAGWGIGYQNFIGTSVDQSKNPPVFNHLVTYEFRGWLRIEGGDLQRNNAKWETVDGGFFRAGPVLQGAVKIATYKFTKDVIKSTSLTVNYSYLSAIYGPNGNASLLKIGAALALYDNPKDLQKISLTASFEKGGLTFSKQEVEVFNIGVGVVF